MAARFEKFAVLEAVASWYRHGFTLREPGLDVKIDRDAALARLDAVHAEARMLAGLGGVPLITVNQVHGCEIAIVNDLDGEQAQRDADALVTDRVGVCLGIFVADCCPVYFIDPQRRCIGLAHAGRRGTELGIARRTAEAFIQNFRSRPEDLVVLLGPCIRPPDYEVDFAAEIVRQCRDLGISHVQDCGISTATNLDRYYSYRMEKGRDGPHARIRCNHVLNAKVPVMKRDFDPAETEIMDRPQPVSDLLRRDLANLEILNRWFGGHRVLQKIIAGWLKPGTTLDLLDIATGGGDNVRLIVTLARRRHCHLRITAIDANPATLQIARENTPHTEYDTIDFLEQDVLCFNPDRKWDIVMCTLALHHFSREDTLQILTKMCLWSSQHAVAIDLRPSLFATIGLQLLTTLWMRNPITRHDSALSMRRAWSVEDLRSLVAEAGWPRTTRWRNFLVARQAHWY